MTVWAKVEKPCIRCAGTGQIARRAAHLTRADVELRCPECEGRKVLVQMRPVGGPGHAR